MNIGFDIDGVLTDIKGFIIKYGKNYFGKYPECENAFSVKEIFNCTDEEENSFWSKYLLKYVTKELPRSNVSNIINELAEENKIFIITLRVFTDKDNTMGKIMRYIVKKWLIKNNIKYDEIIFSENNSKVIDICTNDIDVMIEDDPDNIKKISKYTKIICYDDTYNKDINGKNIYHAKNMLEVRQIVKDIKKTSDTVLDDEIKPLSGLPSIDKPWMKFYTYGQVSRMLPEQKIYDYLKNNNKNNLNAEALSFFGNKIKFDTLFKKIESSAKSLKELGVKKDDVVTIISPNVPEALMTFYAVNRIGAVSCMVHPLSKMNDIKRKINETNSEFIFFIDISYDEVKSIIDENIIKKAISLSCKDSMPLMMKIMYTASLKKTCSFYKDKDKNDKILTWENFLKIGKNYQENLDTPYEKNVPAVILNTGGTTGVSKGAVISNDNFNAMVHQYKMKAEFNKGDKMVALMPIFHGFGLCNSIHMPMCLKASSILIPQFDSKRFYKMLFSEKPNHIMGVPTLWKGIQANKKYEGKDLSFLNGYLVSGGDNMKHEFETQTNKFFETHNSPSKVTKGYGLTECLSSATFTFNDSNEMGSIGIPLVNTNVKVVDPITNEELGYNQEGEICISGPSVMLKYYNNDEETKKDLRYENNKIWLHSGDIGYVNENGLFFFTDRLKRLIIVSGINVYPTKIEQIVEENPDVLECACVAMKHPYKQFVPKVYVVLNEGKILDENIKNNIISMTEKEIPDRYYHIYDVEQIDEFPKTLIGKIDYKKLQDIENEKNRGKSYGKRKI